MSAGPDEAETRDQDLDRDLDRDRDLARDRETGGVAQAIHMAMAVLVGPLAVAFQMRLQG